MQVDLVADSSNHLYVLDGGSLLPYYSQISRGFYFRGINFRAPVASSM